MFGWLRRLFRTEDVEEVVESTEEIIVAETDEGDTVVLDVEEDVVREVHKPRRAWVWMVVAAVAIVAFAIWLCLHLFCQPAPVPVVDNPPPPPVLVTPPPVEPPPPPVVTPPPPPPPAPPPPAPAPKPQPKPVVHHVAPRHHHCH